MRKKKQRKNTQKRSGLDVVLGIFTLGILTVTLFGFLGRFWWIFDLFSHFRVQYMHLCLIPFFIALWKRRNRLAIALVLLVCINYAPVLPLYLGKPAPVAGKPIRAMQMNLNFENGHTREVLDAIGNADPDIVLLEEVSPKWAHELEALKSTYPYKIADPRPDPFGIMLLSKVPLEHGKVVQIGTAGVPSIVAEAYFPQGVISVIGTHPVPPISAEYSRLRNIQLAGLPGIVHAQKHPVLLIGDLNTTPWSYFFKKLLKDSGLKNSMKGFGHQPSWPGNHLLGRIPLDHMLYSDGIAIRNRMVGGRDGSDHLPVIVDFSLR